MDYTAVSPNPTVISFADGETAKTINIPIINDTTTEVNETVTLTLSNPSRRANARHSEHCGADHYRR